MIKLSERLGRVAGYIEDGEGVADIGTDHGYLPLFLLERNPDRKVIFTDVNEGPLGKTKNIIQKEYPHSNLSDYDLRIGDGLDPIKKGEVDAIVIAGMGGILIRDILSADIEKTRSFKKLILQPRTASDKLRKWLHENDLYIYDESLAYENGRISEITAVIPSWNSPFEQKRNDEFKDELDYEFSPIIIGKMKHGEDSSVEADIVEDWLSRGLKKEEYIEESLIRNGSESSKAKLTVTQNRIDRLKGVMES